MAECHYAQIAPHLYCGPVVGAANIQLATCTPNFLILEGIGRWDGIHAELLKKPIRWEDGYVIPPSGARPRRRARRRPSRALHPDSEAHLHLESGQRGIDRTRERSAVTSASSASATWAACLATSLLRAGFPLTVHDRDPAAVAA